MIAITAILATSVAFLFESPMKLTVKQEAFCLAYIETGNASEAYRRSYNAENMKPDGLAVEACKLLKRGNVAHRVARLKEAALETWLATKACDIVDGFYAAKAKRVLSDTNVDNKKTIKAKKTTRYAVFLRAGFKCQCCGAKPMPTNDVVLHLDHVIPKSMGGIDDPINLQALCSECNLSKTNAFAYDHNQEVDLWAN